MITDKTEIQKTQQFFKQQPKQDVWVADIGRKTQPLTQMQITWGIAVVGEKVIADAPYTNDWYIDVIIWWKKVRLMTTA